LRRAARRAIPVAMSARLLCIVSLLIALFAPASGAPAFTA
jgi:hypothetical protein